MGQHGKPMPGEEHVEPMPAEYLEYRLCELFHCRPSELDEEDWDRVQSAMIVHNAMNEYQSRPRDGSAWRVNLDG